VAVTIWIGDPLAKSQFTIIPYSTQVWITTWSCQGRGEENGSVRDEWATPLLFWPSDNLTLPCHMTNIDKLIKHFFI